MSAEHGTAVGLVHAAAVVVPSVVLAASVVVELRRAAVREGRALPGPALTVAGGAAAVAAGAHVLAAASHAEHLTVVGFLLAVAAAQALWACAVLSGGRSTALLRHGATATLGLLVLWAVSRTTGLPVGPHTEVDPVTWVDLAAVAAQVTALLGVGRALGLQAAQPTGSRSAAG